MCRADAGVLVKERLPVEIRPDGAYVKKPEKVTSAKKPKKNPIVCHGCNRIIASSIGNGSPVDGHPCHIDPDCQKKAQERALRKKH